MQLLLISKGKTLNLTYYLWLNKQFNIFIINKINYYVLCCYTSTMRVGSWGMYAGFYMSEMVYLYPHTVARNTPCPLIIWKHLTDSVLLSCLYTKRMVTYS